MKKYMEKLNEEQKEAVNTTEGYVRVIAGAGTGKTNTLTLRYVHLIEDLKIDPNNILCVTFTNKAANEMRNRIRKMTKNDNDTGYISTFHSFCLTFLKDEIQVLKYPQNFIVIDDEDIEQILKKVYDKYNIKKNEYSFKNTKKIIETYKRENDYVSILLENSEKIKEKQEKAEKIKDKIIYGYLYEQKKMYGLDFNDLIAFTLYILNEYKEICRKWQKQFKYIMVDEFQDVNDRQFELVDVLSKYNNNLFVVGDPDQMIYSFRGANVDYILNFDTKFKNTKTIILNTNYRSCQKILDASNKLIKHNIKRINKDLKTVRGSGEIPVFYHAPSYKEECKFVVDQIKMINEMEDNLSNIAVLYRGNYYSRGLEEELAKNSIPYVIYSGISFYSRREIKDVLSYLRLIANEDDLSFKRIINMPRRGFGPRRMEDLENYSINHNCTLYEGLKRNINKEEYNKKEFIEFVNLVEKYRNEKMSILDMLEGILTDTEYEELLKNDEDEERLENIEELKESIKDYESSRDIDASLIDYLNRIALYTNMDKKEKSKAVKLMTVHSAKGLEFKYVFVCGMSEGIFPSRKATDMEEERRLCYVACTRAKDSLFLTDSSGYDFDSNRKHPSRFIEEIGKDNLHYIREIEEDIEDDKDVEKPEKLKFSVGDKVISKKYGMGTVIMANYRRMKYVVMFEKDNLSVLLDYNEPLKLYVEDKEENIENENENKVKKKSKK